MAGSAAYRRAGGCRRRTPARSVRARCWSTRELGDVRRDRARKGKEVTWDITEEVVASKGEHPEVESDEADARLTILMLISSEIPDENGRCRVKEQRELGVRADGHGLSRQSGMVLSSEWIDAEQGHGHWRQALTWRGRWRMRPSTTSSSVGRGWRRTRPLATSSDVAWTVEDVTVVDELRRGVWMTEDSATAAELRCGVDGGGCSHR
ncbi:hypothetical protein OsJ_29705 [Oryza sativa Japonica Group]|uniref:Uncharacterized protein n=1 Tax=Oryza sativa subsp. japonica TaxID=39947 RepID=A3BZS5_ORYSJ|nr:hypothetical protein OsJ_29705 [Oryza sativa Japonica Group]